MEINKIFLENFRNYPKKEISFSKGLNLIVGPNACGKTNLLEAVYLLASGKSFHAKLEAEMISWGREIGRIKGKISGSTNLEIVLTKGEVTGQKTAKKRYLVNGVGRRMLDFVGNLRGVYFGPEDLELIINSPSIRRDYLDGVLEQVDRDYRRASLSYKKGLRQRNRLLEQIRDEGKPKSILFFWDKLLIENGGVISNRREEYINFINEQPEYFGKLNVDYDRSVISAERLEKYSSQEVASGMTLVGPHRDDFIVGISDMKDAIRNLHLFGSRGEQRTAVFSLKLAELEFMAQKTGDPSASLGEAHPVLLLDDIFSELDHEHRDRLLEVIPKQQTIMTTTDIHLIEPNYRKKMEIINLGGKTL